MTINPISAADYADIRQSFPKMVRDIYADNLVCAFVVGSVHKGHATHADDIDGFVISIVSHEEQHQRCRDAIRELASRHDMQYDEDFPLENPH